MSRTVPRLLVAVVVAYAASWLAYGGLRLGGWPVGSAYVATTLGAIGVFLERNCPDWNRGFRNAPNM